ncbi:MAG: beta-lactamase family protein [Hyphomonadaceae bacterium]|nr:beta-lactamase family protein [Hyphomonadaceae bacterium]
MQSAGALALTACASTRAEPSVVLAAAMEGHATPGMAALTIRDFQAGAEEVAGVRRLGGDDPIRPGDRWHLGSDGKAITATLIARLVERGALSWDARLDQMLPELAGAMHADYRDVTLPDLLAHRSGLPENVAGGAPEYLRPFYSDRESLTALRLRMVADGLAEAPAAAKRAEQSYSNTGYLVAAAAAERATGRSFEDLMREEVLGPLEMRSAVLSHVGGRGEPAGHVDGRVAEQPFDVNPPMFTPPGGFRMSMGDWARFCIDQMKGERGDGALLRAESYRFLHTAQGETNAALGWGARTGMLGRAGRGLSHSGSDGNWFALVVLFPDEGAGVLVAANAGESMGGDAATLVALRAFVAALG